MQINTCVEIWVSWCSESFRDFLGSVIAFQSALDHEACAFEMVFHSASAVGRGRNLPKDFALDGKFVGTEAISRFNINMVFGKNLWILSMASLRWFIGRSTFFEDGFGLPLTLALGIHVEVLDCLLLRWNRDQSIILVGGQTGANTLISRIFSYLALHSIVILFRCSRCFGIETSFWRLRYIYFLHKAIPIRIL